VEKEKTGTENRHGITSFSSSLGCVRRNVLTFFNGGTFRYLETVTGTGVDPGDVMLSRHAAEIIKALMIISEPRK